MSDTTIKRDSEDNYAKRGNDARKSVIKDKIWWRSAVRKHNVEFRRIQIDYRKKMSVVGGIDCWIKQILEQ